MNALTVISGIDDSFGEAASSPETALQRARILKARKSFSCRRVDLAAARQLIRDAVPKAGDLVLASVETIGHHTKLETPAGRRAKLYPGDEIIVSFGARYAPDQFEAEVPSELSSCELVASGGIAANVLSRHTKTRRATRIKPIGLLADGLARPLNLSNFAIEDPAPRTDRATVIAIAGTSMNAGKTTTAAALIHGLAKAGLRVAGIKGTGTGSGGDLWSMTDAGAEWVFDFTDMGFATTAGLPVATLEKITAGLVDHATALGADVVVLEIADGIFQRETSGLLKSPAFKELIAGVLFAASDAMGSVGGTNWLACHNLPVLALSGLVTASPLATKEVVANVTVQVVTPEELMDPHSATNLCFGISGCSDVQIA